MPNKRKRRNQTHQFYCFHCQQRLWRLGSPKYHLFYKDASEIKKNLGITNKKACFLAAQNSTYVDRNVWLEEFFCEEHGKVWMRIAKQTEGALTATPAKESDWQRTSHTIDPNIPNPSVSQYTYTMSRGAQTQLV